MPSSSSIRSSARSTRSRSSVRGDMTSLGLEDELSFGSDEDTMETIGEIEFPEEEAPDLSLEKSTSRMSKNGSIGPGATSGKLRKSLRSTTSLRPGSSKKKENVPSLGSSTHLLPPLPPVPSGSTLDLPAEMFGERERPKRGSIMGAFKVKKGLRRWRDDQSTQSFMTETSAPSTISLHKVTSNTSSRPSYNSSFAQTPSTYNGSAVPQHLAPLSLPSIDSADRLSIGRASIGRTSIAESFEQKAVKQTESPPYTPAKLSLSRKTGATWAPSEISNAIFPGFPATISGLEPITVFTAQASKRPPSSILSAAGTNGSRQSPNAVKWTPCTLVFTLFKVSLSGPDAAVASANGADEERTVAHVHVFTSPRAVSNGSSSMRRSKSIASPQFDTGSQRVEVERRILSRDSTASVCKIYTDADGRAVVLSIYFGNEDRTKAGNEWILEMKDDRQLHEWIRQIKKTAIMINAEELGYGRAIRPIYEDTGVSADELAHKLSVHARAVAESRETPVKRAPEVQQGSPQSQEEHRPASLEALQGIYMSRSRSVDALDTRTSTLGLVHRKSGSDTTPGSGDSGDNMPESLLMGGNMTHNYLGNQDDDDDLGDLSQMSMSGIPGFSFGSSFSFPAPPSALPAPPRPPVFTRINVPASPGLSSPSHMTSGASTPAMASTPNLTMSFKHEPSPVSPASTFSLNGGPDSLVDAPKTAPEIPVVRESQPAEDDTPPLLATPIFGSKTLAEEDVEPVSLSSAPPHEVVPIRAPSPSPSPAPAPISLLQTRETCADSIASSSGQSVTSRLRRLRGKPQVIDIMAEFSAAEAEFCPPQHEEEEEPIRDDRERRIRFA